MSEEEALEFERQRAERIARNKAALQQLNVLEAAQQLVNLASDGTVAKSAPETKQPKTSKRTAAPVLPQRRSSRKSAAAASDKIKSTLMPDGDGGASDDSHAAGSRGKASSRNSSQRTASQRSQCHADENFTPDASASDADFEEELGELEEEVDGGEKGKVAAVRGRGGKKGSASGKAKGKAGAATPAVKKPRASTKRAGAGETGADSAAARPAKRRTTAKKQAVFQPPTCEEVAAIFNMLEPDSSGFVTRNKVEAHAVRMGLMSDTSVLDAMMEYACEVAGCGEQRMGLSQFTQLVASVFQSSISN